MWIFDSNFLRLLFFQASVMQNCCLSIDVIFIKLANYFNKLKQFQTGCRFPSCYIHLCHVYLLITQMARTQRNKATMGHLGLLKARLAQLRRELIEPKGGGGGGAGEGFDVAKTGDARIGFVGLCPFLDLLNLFVEAS